MGYTYYDVKDFYELQANCGALKKYGIYPDTSCRVKRIDGEEVKAPLNSEIVKEKLLRLTYDFDALNKPVPKDIPKSELSLWFEYEEKRREEEIEDLISKTGHSLENVKEYFNDRKKQILYTLKKKK